MRPDAKIRMFVYQPVYKKVDGEKVYVNTKTWQFPYYPAKKGDVFTGEKRVKEFIEMQKHATSKVVAVRYNYRDGTCGVILQDQIIEEKTEPPVEPTSTEEPKTDETTEEVTAL